MISGDADRWECIAILGLIAALFIKNVKIEKTKIKTPRADEKAPSADTADPEAAQDGNTHASNRSPKM